MVWCTMPIEIAEYTVQNTKRATASRIPAMHPNACLVWIKLLSDISGKIPRQHETIPVTRPKKDKNTANGMNNLGFKSTNGSEAQCSTIHK